MGAYKNIVFQCWSLRKLLAGNDLYRRGGRIFGVFRGTLKGRSRYEVLAAHEMNQKRLF